MSMMKSLKSFVQGIIGKREATPVSEERIQAALAQPKAVLPEVIKPTAVPLPKAETLQKSRQQLKKAVAKLEKPLRRRGVFNAMGRKLSRWDCECLALQMRAAGRRMQASRVIRMHHGVKSDKRVMTREDIRLRGDKLAVSGLQQACAHLYFQIA